MVSFEENKFWEWVTSEEEIVLVKKYKEQVLVIDELSKQLDFALESLGLSTEDADEAEEEEGLIQGQIVMCKTRFDSPC